MVNTLRTRADNGRSGISVCAPAAWVLFLVALCAQPSTAGAEASWSIMGKVVSSQTGEALPFANVALSKVANAADTAGTQMGGASAMGDGTFRIPAPPGSYRLFVTYVSYKAKKSAVFEVKAGAPPVTVDIAMTPEGIVEKEIMVQARNIRDTEASILAGQKRAAAVSDGVSSQQIAKSSDSNAAEVLQRVTGLSMVDGRYVFVRGMGERYSSTEINGATISTPEPNKRVVPLDLFDSGLLDNVVVQKTYTADQPGEFGGGVVNVSTRDFPGKPISSLSLTLGGNGNTNGEIFDDYYGGKYDMFGFDDGTRALPDLMRELAGNTKVVQRSFVTHQGGFGADSLEMLGESFNKTWAHRIGRAYPVTGMNGTYGNEFKIGDHPLGLLGSITYDRTDRTLTGLDNSYFSDGGLLTPNTEYETTASTTNVLWGALLNTSYRVNDYHTVALRTMYNRSADDETRIYEGNNNNWSSNVRNTRFDYVERGIFSGSISTSSYLPALRGSTLDLRFNYSRADRDEPDRREFTYQEEIRGTESIWKLTQRSVDQGLTRMFGDLQDEERSPELAITMPFKQWSGLDSKLKAGLSYRNKSRDSQWRRFTYMTPTGMSATQLDSLLQLLPEQFMINELIAGDVRSGFRIEELTKQDTDNYRAHQEVMAEYVTADFPIRQDLRAVVGARVEHANIDVDSYDLFGVWPDSLLSKARLNDTDFLPALNLTWNVTKDINVRGAYSGTLSRPDFRELSAQNMYDFVGGYPEVGNPNLKRARIQNLDFRVENYPGMNELLAASFFYKWLKDPIERSIQGGSVATYMPINAHRGYVTGIELESRVGLGRLSHRLTPLAINANYTRVKSETDVEGFGVETDSKRPLQGQADYLLNLGMFYASSTGSTTGSLLFNFSGTRLASVGIFGLPDIYEQPRNSLDLVGSQTVGMFRFKMALENILDDDVVFEQEQPEVPGVAEEGSKVTHTSHIGRSLSLSVGLQL